MALSCHARLPPHPSRYHHYGSLPSTPHPSFTVRNGPSNLDTTVVRCAAIFPCYHTLTRLSFHGSRHCHICMRILKPLLHQFHTSTSNVLSAPKGYPGRLFPLKPGDQSLWCQSPLLPRIGLFSFTSSRLFSNFEAASIGHSVITPLSLVASPAPPFHVVVIFDMPHEFRDETRDTTGYRVAPRRVLGSLQIKMQSLVRFARRQQGTCVHIEPSRTFVLQSMRLLRLKCTAIMPHYAMAVQNAQIITMQPVPFASVELGRNCRSLAIFL